MSQKTPSPTGEEEHTTEETNPPQTTKRGPETADPAHPHTTGTHQAHQKRGKTNGIDFWHAVEFSRIRRAPHQAFRPSVGATSQSYTTQPGRFKPAVPHLSEAPNQAVEGA